MKLIVLHFTLLVIASTTIQSCKKDEVTTPVTTNETINVTIKNNEDHIYDLGGFGDEEGAIISRQATHYQISSLTRDANFAKITYHYQAALNYTGSDEVELTTSKGSDGRGGNEKITVTTIKFTITN